MGERGVTILAMAMQPDADVITKTKILLLICSKNHFSIIFPKVKYEIHFPFQQQLEAVQNPSPYSGFNCGNKATGGVINILNAHRSMLCKFQDHYSPWLMGTS